MKNDKYMGANQTDNIEKLYDKYSKRLYFTSYRIVGNEYDAEEIMQDTFLKYYKYPRKEEIKNIESWLVSICIRASIDVIRKKKRDEELIDGYCKDNMNKEEHSEQETMIPTNGITIDIVKKALIMLPDTLRSILSLHLVEGYDYDEIENITGLNGNTIRSRYMRGKEKLALEVKNMIQA